jgi:hypothetical protein
MVVHHVEVHPVGTGGGDVVDLFAEAGEIGGEDGRAMMQSFLSVTGSAFALAQGLMRS